MLTWIALAWLASLGATFAVRGAALARAKAAFQNREDRLAISLAWAWATPRDLGALAYSHGEQRLGPIFTEPRIRLWRLANPIVLLGVAGVLLYQFLLRGDRGFKTGDCPAVPNCSNYAIGAVLRFGLIEGIAKTVIRLKTCDGDHARVSFHERHL